MSTKLERITSTALVEAGPVFLKSVVLTPAAAKSTVVIEDSAAGSGTALLSLQAAADGASAVWQSPDSEGVLFSAGIYATLAGTGAAVSIEFER